MFLDLDYEINIVKVLHYYFNIYNGFAFWTSAQSATAVAFIFLKILFIVWIKFWGRIKARFWSGVSPQNLIQTINKIKKNKRHGCSALRWCPKGEAIITSKFKFYLKYFLDGSKLAVSIDWMCSRDSFKAIFKAWHREMQMDDFSKHFGGRHIGCNWLPLLKSQF